MYVYICQRTCCREMIIGGTNLSDLIPALNSGYPTEFCMHRGAQRQYCQNLCICTSCISKSTKTLLYLLCRYKSTKTDAAHLHHVLFRRRLVFPGQKEETEQLLALLEFCRRYSAYLLYWYKTTKSDSTS